MIKTNERSNQRVRKLVMTAMLSAVAAVLMILNFSVPFMPFFIKLDFSEMPALIAAYSMGPLSGVAVCLIKNVINLLIKSSITGGVGEICNFLLGVAFVLPAGLVYRIRKTRKAAFWSAVIGTCAMAVIGLLLNYFIIYPIYATIMPIEQIIGMYQAILPGVDGLFVCLVTFNLPFTILKGLLNTTITFLIYKRISPLIKGSHS